MWKRVLKIIVIAVTVIITGIALLVLIASKVPTYQDAQASGLIWREFVNASTNIIVSKPVKIFSSPRRAATRLYIYGDLSEKEEQALQTLALQISKDNSNRPLSIEFQKEIPEGMNN